MTTYRGPGTIVTSTGARVAGEVLWQAGYDGLWHWNGVFWASDSIRSLHDCMGELMVLEEPGGATGDVLITSLLDDRAVFQGSGPFPGKKEEK